MSAERRRAQRLTAHFAVEIETPMRSRLAICRNRSVHGMLLASHGGFAPGQAVTLRFRGEEAQDAYQRVQATVIRAGLDEGADFWMHWVAVEMAVAPLDRLDETEVQQEQ